MFDKDMADELFGLKLQLEHWREQDEARHEALLQTVRQIREDQKEIAAIVKDCNVLLDEAARMAAATPPETKELIRQLI